MSRARKFILILHVLLVLATALAYLSPITHPGKSPIPGLVSLVFPVLLLLNVVLLVFWVFVKELYALLSIAIIAIGWKHVTAYVQLGSPSKEEVASENLTVATYNTFQFNKLKGASTSISQGLSEAIEKIGSPDILCLQEAAGAYKERTKIDYPYAYRVPNSFGIVFSKVPAIKSGRLSTDPHRSLSGWFDFEFEQGTIRVYALHLSSNHLTNDSEELLTGANLQDKRTWLKGFDLLKRYSRASRIRSDQAEIIARHIAESPHPVIVCGDFNDIALSHAYNRLRTNLSDSFIDCGFGTSVTYAGSIRGLRIDYILASEEIEFQSHNTYDLALSDHLPVVASFTLHGDE